VADGGARIVYGYYRRWNASRVTAAVLTCYATRPAGRPGGMLSRPPRSRRLLGHDHPHDPPPDQARL